MMLGVFAFINLPIDLIPEINPPYLVVMCTYSGAGPEEVERSITRILEVALSSVSNMEMITSISSKGSGIVIMEFIYGTNLIDASNQVRDSLDRIRNYLPSGAQAPMIFKFDPSMVPIMDLMVTGNRSSEELRELSESIIIPRIEQSPGVATASLSGGREKIIKVEIPQSRLEAYGLTISSLQQMLAIQNMQVSAGTIIENNLSYILTTMGEYTSLEEIRNTVISYRGGGLVGTQVELPRQVLLRDIADVYIGYRDEDSVVFVNGQAAVMLSVQKQSGKNAVQTAKDLRVRLEKIDKEIPLDVKITEISNTTDQIEISINQVGSTAILGMILAITVLFVFLRSVKPTLIIGISIPVSIIVTIMFMYFAGLTLNLMTLAGLVLGVGMLVDNSIVILENIYRYREKGAKLKTAAVIGTHEMIIAITASTITTICVFAPLVMFQGLLEMAGEIFSGLAFTVVISLSISLFVALFLVPVLASHFFPLVTRKQKPIKNTLAPIDKAFAGFFTGLDNAYKNAVAKVLHHKTITITIIALLFIASVLMVPVVGYVLMPSQEANSVSISVTLPVGSPVAETEAILRRIEAIVKQEIPDEAYTRLTLSAGGGGMLGLGGSSGNSGSIRLNLPELSTRIMSANDIHNVMRSYFNQFPGVDISFGGGGNLAGMSAMSMLMGGNPVDIALRTDDLVKGKEMAIQIAELIKDIPEVTEPSISLEDGLPQIEIVLDRERIYALGLNTITIGNEIKAAVDGITATRYKEGANTYDVVLILKEADRSTRPALDKIFVNSQLSGQRIPLSNFASYREGTGPITINRENQSRVIHVTAGARLGTDLNTLENKVRELVSANIPYDDDIIIEYVGDNAEFVKLMWNFSLIVVVAIALVFGIMASLFESFKDPFIIIFTIPLSVIGIVAIYFFTGEMFNIITLVGILVLLGIMVNNGIILVDYTNLLRKRGYPLFEACVEAARSRLRPILMTTLTTVLGLIPMSFFPGEGSEFVGPIGKTVLGGLSFGTLMTLFLMPTLYYIMNRRSDERAAKALARRERIAAGLSKKDAIARDSAETETPQLPDTTATEQQEV
jgi:HAE1 family hydrophobic/amphiphilic exporter-1